MRYGYLLEPRIRGFFTDSRTRILLLYRRIQAFIKTDIIAEIARREIKHLDYNIIVFFTMIVCYCT